MERLDDLSNQDVIDHPDVAIPDDAGISVTPGAVDDDPLGLEDDDRSTSGEEIRRIAESNAPDGDKRAELARVVEDETGVDTDFEEFSADQAAAAAETFTEMHERGEADGVEGVVSTLTDEQREQVGETVGAHFSDSNTVYLNPDHFTDETAAEYSELGYLAAGTREHMVNHEIAHNRHVEADRAGEFAAGEKGEKDYFDVRERGLKTGEEELLREQVSEYATDGPDDARAEIYALLAAGESLPDDVMELYAVLEGIAPESEP
jgi:hypothetical protein